MIDIPVQVLELLKLDSVKKNFRIHFPNGEADDIINDDCMTQYDNEGNLIIGATKEGNHLLSETVSFTESLCSQDSLKFGLCESNVLEFECHLKEPIKGAICQATLEVDASSLNGSDSEYQNLDYVCCEANKRVVYTKNKYDLKKFENFILRSNDTPIVYVWARLADSLGIWGDWYCAYSYDNKVALGDGIDKMPVDEYIAPSVKQFMIEHNRRKDEHKGSGAVNVEYYRTDYVEDARYIQFCIQFSMENGACWIDNSRIEGIVKRDDLDYPIYSIPYGLYIIDSDDRKSENLILRKVEAYSPLISDENTVTGEYFGTWTGMSPIERAKMHYEVKKSDYNIDLVKFIYSNIPFMGTDGLSFEKMQMSEDTYETGDGAIYNDRYPFIKLKVYYKKYAFKSQEEANELYAIKYDKSNELVNKMRNLLTKTIIPKYGKFKYDNNSHIFLDFIDMTCYAYFNLTNPYIGLNVRNIVKLTHNENFLYPWIAQKKSGIRATYGKGYIYIELPYKAEFIIEKQDGSNIVETAYGKYQDPFIAKADVHEFSTINISFARRQKYLKSKYYICPVADSMAKAHKTKIIAGATAEVISEEEDNTDLLKLSSNNGAEFSWRDFIESFLELNAMFCMWDRWNECYKFKGLDRGNFIFPTNYADISKNKYPKKSGLYPHGDAWSGESSFANIHDTYYKTTNLDALFPDDELYPSDELYPDNGVVFSSKSNGFYKTTWWSDTKSAPYRAVTCAFTLVLSVNKTDVSLSTTDDVYEEYTIPKGYDTDGNPIEYLESDKAMTYDISENWIIKNIPILDVKIVESWMKRLAGALEGISFYSTDTEMLGLPYLEAGDWIRIHANSYDGTLYATPIFRRTLTGVHALIDQITSSNEET